MYNESNIDSYENVRFPLIEQNSNFLKYAFPMLVYRSIVYRRKF